MQTITGKDIRFAADLLEEGELVAIPTETVYGLAGNALDENTVLKIFTTKQRPVFDPLIVHIRNEQEVQNYAVDIPDIAYKLMQNFWPGPLTLLLNKKQVIPDLVTSGLNTVALRVPDHGMLKELLNLVKFPLAAPSANPFGYISPTTAQHVADQLQGKISYILDGGPCKIGIESTIIGFENNNCVLYRPGGLPASAIEKITGTKVIMRLTSTSTPHAPGLLESHYAPRKPVYFGDMKELISMHNLKNAALLCFTGNAVEYPGDIPIYKLSQKGDIEEAARNLFSALRNFDQSAAQFLLAEKFPEEGLGLAINDRLKRASVKN